MIKPNLVHHCSTQKKKKAKALYRSSVSQALNKDQVISPLNKTPQDPIPLSTFLSSQPENGSQP